MLLPTAVLLIPLVWCSCGEYPRLFLEVPLGLPSNAFWEVADEWKSVEEVSWGYKEESKSIEEDGEEEEEEHVVLLSRIVG